MGNFIKGVLLGVGIALLVAPKKGEEMRAMLSERIDALRASAEKSDTLKQIKQKVTESVQQGSQSWSGRTTETRARDHAGNPISPSRPEAPPRPIVTDDTTRSDPFNQPNR
ncbi:hypothetical protein KDW_59930 [Dictyobacter vulcani]|uniref:YtxH domain-containing protein n=1 Tax=Dictyobacter vulcani TaxID=2607529 RepID=A0A5J4KZD4_9CHLR|nr:YtxH domain-containing protein [Dictyobacter vulcani]GER91831.1 hypothetical protein KDW_59930 [Dictyobacter vulcani]